MPTSGVPAHDNTTPPATIAAIPKAMRRSKFSLKMNQAIVAVKTPSRLSSNDADDAGVSFSPISSRIGPIIPPETMALPSHVISFARKPASRGFWKLNKCRVASQTVRPIPDPK
jgi:hypothetical protein